MARAISKEVAISCLAIGILQLLVGLCIIITTAVFAGKISIAVVLPYWSGFPLLFLGVLGIVAGVLRSKGVVIAYLVVCIIILIVMLISSIFTSIASALYNLALSYMNKYKCYSSYSGCVCYTTNDYSWVAPRTTYSGFSCGRLTTIGVLLELLTALSVIGLFLCLAGSIVGCIAACCQKEEETTVIVQQNDPRVLMHPQPQSYPSQQPYQPLSPQQDSPPSYSSPQQTSFINEEKQNKGEEPKSPSPKHENLRSPSPKPQEPKSPSSKPQEPKSPSPKPQEPKSPSPKPQEPKSPSPEPQQSRSPSPKDEQPKPQSSVLSIREESL